MSNALHVHVREAREQRGWTQQELAARAGLSRAGVSAIETGRLVPSTAAALALAAALGLRVESLFRLGDAPDDTATGPAWAWPPTASPTRYWGARVGAHTLAYPVEPLVAGAPPHDGLAGREAPAIDEETAGRTLVLAGCDPAAGLLVAEARRQARLRLIVLPRGSGAALHLLGEDLVHVAGVHLGGDAPDGNDALIRRRLGPDHTLLRLASWESGIALTPGRRVTSVRGARGAALRWIGREEGSGARQCLDEILDGRPAPTHVARDHHGVASAIRLGFADAGVCPRLVSEEASLRFIPVRREAYDLVHASDLADDWRVAALREVVRSSRYRRLLGELPGYDAAEAGALRPA